MKEIKESAEESIKIMLIGTKLDKIQDYESERKIKESEVFSFCEENNLLYEETSAKNNQKIKESVDLLINRNYLLL